METTVWRTYPPYTFTTLQPSFQMHACAPKILSFFSGIGGLDLGFLEAGFRIEYASDIDAESVNIYNRNFHHCKSVCIPIQKIDPIQLPKHPDVILGAFPCQGFSSAGKRDILDQRNTLAWEMIRIVKELQPRFVISENVLGLATMRHPDGGLAINHIVHDLKKLGYSARWKILDASQFGVPSIRKRLILIAHYNNEEIIFPDELNRTYLIETEKIPLKKVLAIMPNTAISLSDEKAIDYPYQNVYKPLSPSDLKLSSYIPKGGNWRDIPAEQQPERFQKIVEKWGKKSPGFYRRPTIDQICGTLTATMNISHCMALHPLENRRYSVREAATIQSFPFEFVFSENITQAYREIGNAVPPFLAWQIARVIKLQLEGKKRHELSFATHFTKQSSLLSY